MLPYLYGSERRAGGHAVIIMVYDDAIEIVNKKDGKKQVGGFFFQNSGGTDWGNNGRRFISYAYFVNQDNGDMLADDISQGRR